MTELRKAAEMALEALETFKLAQNPIVPQSIYVLRQALAQPEQGCAECGVKASDGYALYCVKCTELFTQPEQEPVMEVQYFWDSPVYILLQPISDGAKLYTAPPIKPWVSLTEEEKRLFASWLDDKTDDEVFNGIEAALRKKNDRLG